MVRFRLVGWSVPLLAFVVTATAGIAAGYLLRPRPAPPNPAERLADTASEMPRWEWSDARPDISRSTEQKRQVARRVIDGTSTLVEAAAAMRGIDRRSPQFRWEAFRAIAPDTTDAERHCREVIFWVEHVRPQSQDADELVSRLEAEIECRVQDGSLTLPDDAP